ncbi:MAG: phosphoribosylglycinamide formyltransferase [Negativicutes bacterium]
MKDKPILGVLCSGRGTNLQSIMTAVESGQIPASIGVVLTDKPEAKALERAEKAGIPHAFIDRRAYETRRDFEEQLVAKLRQHDVSLVILAGFMRILSPYFVQQYPGRILNVHPALLPAFPGAHAHRDVLAYGVKVSGCTIHFVDEGTDSGPIILQAAVPVLPEDTEETLAERILDEEHRLYPRAIALCVKGQLRVEGRHVHILS